jgi:putative oxygen-independent coproporphyrinogen III oxidase
LESSDPLGLYLHVPFCVSHCTYCDFYTKPFPGEPAAGRFARALSREIRVSAESLGLSGRRVDTLYVGGGTPSLLEPSDLEAILESAASVFRVDSGAEISMEVNPESAGPEKLRAFRALGASRLSLGVQSFQREVLETLGRAHSPEAARAGVEAARSAGFRNLSLDLMLALPGQSLASWDKDLDEALALSPDHLSAYLLEMDKETALRSRIERGELKPVSEDEAAEMYHLAAGKLQEAGMLQYEISSFAREGFRCRHNMKYWTDLPFLGCGPSAWSYLEGRRFRVTRDLEGYLEAVGRGVPPDREEDAVPAESRLSEAIFAGLRLLEGIDVEAVGRAYGVPDPLGARLPRILELEEAGLLRRDGTRIRLTSRGLTVANEVFRAFL